MQTIGELPLGNVVTIAPDATLDAAFLALLATDATELYVVDDQGQLAGIVPDYELLKARLAGDDCGATVARFMSSHVLCYTAETPIAAAVADFRNGFHTRAAVLENGRLIGQITRSGVLRAICTPKSSRVPRPKLCNSELARNALTLLSVSPA